MKRGRLARTSRRRSACILTCGSVFALIFASCNHWEEAEKEDEDEEEEWEEEEEEEEEEDKEESCLFLWVMSVVYESCLLYRSHVSDV